MSGFRVTGATVVDGTGAPGRIADVLVVDDRIARVDQIDGTEFPEIDGSGRVLAPGFIDTHSHDDYAVIIYPDMGFKVRGGVTTVVVGNCGHGAYPQNSGDGFVEMIHGEPSLPAWDSYEKYLEYLERSPCAVNVAALIGHGTVRASVMGLEDREPTPDELNAMKAMISEGMQAGCFGLSTGLVYPPSMYANIEELSEVAGVIADHGGLYTSHIRNENDRLLEAISEAIEIGRRAGIGVVISHLKAAGKENFGLVSEALSLIDAAGPSVAADQYPYPAGSTGLAAVVSGTIGEMGPSDVVIASTVDHPHWHGHALTDLVDELGVPESEIAETVLALEPTAMVIVHTMDEEDVRMGVQHPEIMVGSDGVPTLDGHPHPRLYGTFARVLGRYSRDFGLLPIEAAVHKMTGRPAAVFGIKDRGEIRPGAFADLVLFDPAAIADVGTFEDPHHFPEGIDRVWVNGQDVVVDGAPTGTRPGRPLRRN